MNEQPDQPDQPDESSRPPQRRSWYRFGLRALLVFITLAAVPCGWLAIQVNRARQEEMAIAELKKAHSGNLNLLLANPFERDRQGQMEMLFQGGPAWLKSVLGVDIFRTVVSVTCYAPGNTFHYEADDTGQLVIRREYKTGAADADLRWIAQLSNVKHVTVEASPVGDEGVAHLAGLKQLELLNLSLTNVTDKSLETIVGLPSLKTLNISRTVITDQALEQLAACKSLTELNVDITKVSKEGVARLREQLPDCEIEE